MNGGWKKLPKTGYAPRSRRYCRCVECGKDVAEGSRTKVSKWAMGAGEANSFQVADRSATKFF